MNQVCVFLLSDQMKCALMEATNKCVVYVVISKVVLLVR